jgi:pilus assembly protein Flp/PilA
MSRLESVQIWFRDVLNKLTRDEEGQDMIEYALLAALISIVAIVMILAIGPYIQNTFQDVANALAST